MRQQYAISAMFLTGVLFPVSAAAAPDDSNSASQIDAALSLVNKTISNGYRAAPALMLGFAVLIAIPLMAFASRMWTWSRAPRQTPPRKRHRNHADDDSAQISGDVAHLPGHAYLEVVGSNGARFTILRDMLRIGSEDDNDIRIPSNKIDRYHAAIHREDLGEYRIVDLSGRIGQGVFVNGQRCTDAPLHDGDMIELGPGRLKFHAGLL